MSAPYDPRKAIRGATRAMNRYVRKHDTTLPVDLSVSTTAGALPCCVLLKSLTEGGPVPDDFTGLTSAAAIKAYVRPDGAVFIGAYELQGHPESVVLVYGPAKMTSERAERIASMDRRALTVRHNQWALGPFAARPAVSPSSPSSSPLSSSSSIGAACDGLS